MKLRKLGVEGLECLFCNELELLSFISIFFLEKRFFYLEKSIALFPDYKDLGE